MRVEMSEEFTQRFENMLITPEIAKEMLTHNYEGNRNVRETYVMQLAAVMKSGRYISQNGQTLVFGIDDGILYDGQHRLRAIVESGTTQVFGIARIKDGKEAYKTIDNGTRRQAADFLHVPSKNNAAAVGKFMSCVEWGDAPLLSCLQGKWDTKTQVDRGIIVDYVNQNADKVTDAVRKGSVMRNAIGVSSIASFSDFIMLVRYCETDELLDEFVGDFTKAAPDSRTTTALKMTIMKSFTKATNRPNKKWMLGTLLDGYNHFSEMDDSTMLNKQSIRIQQYQKYMEAMRARKDVPHAKRGRKQIEQVVE